MQVAPVNKSVKFLFAAVIFAGGIAGYYFFMKGHESVLVIQEAQDRQAAPHMPYLPDISHFNTKEIAAQVPPLREGEVALRNMGNFPDFAEFMEDDGARHLRLLQHRINPRALVILDGDYDFRTLYDAVVKLGLGKLIEKDGDQYLLRTPLLIGAKASLTITGDQVLELRLSKQSNAFLANSGRLFILKTKVMGWDESTNGPSKFKDKNDFRPFITTWDGSHLFIAGSRIESLGYLKGKSYGLSYSTCTECLKENPKLPRPTGAVVESYFTDMFYGFYCYEADDVAIVGNTYADNIIYGVDPHDRSRRLIIAGNEAYGSKKKHGIIVSREVDNSWIFDNNTHNNHGSGIMIDRGSVNNVVANNNIHDNEQDGITFFESQNNVTWNNKISKNKKDGVRIRNSWGIRLNNDKFNMNKDAAIEAYAVDISGQKGRDFQLDPYTKKADVVVYGAKIQANGVSVFKIDDVDFMTLAGVKISAGTHLFPKTVQYDESALLKMLEKQDTVVRVRIP